MEGRAVRILLRLWAGAVMLFLYVPILVVLLYAFNRSNIQSWPISSYSLKWFSVAFRDPDVRSSLSLSLKAGLLATAVAIVLGTAASFAVHRFRFFGREVVSFVLVLPIALPGIITGIALASFFGFAGVALSLWTI